MTPQEILAKVATYRDALEAAKADRAAAREALDNTAEEAANASLATIRDAVRELVAAATGVAEVRDGRVDTLISAAGECTPLEFQKLARAVRVSSRETITLPAGEYEGLSRGKGWCRQGTGSSAEWGKRVDGGYAVGEGRWTVGSSDGYSRKDSVVWVVTRVGRWLLAS